MAKLYVSEYSGVSPVVSPGNWPRSGQGVAQVAGAPPITEQVLTIGGASAPSAAFNANTRMVRLHADAICSVAFGATPGATPVATANNARMAANQTEYFGVSPGQIVAVITNS